MARKKYIRRKIKYQESYHEAWPQDATTLLMNYVSGAATCYKYVRFGVTTDVKSQYDIHHRQDSICWSTMQVLCQTDDPRSAKRLVDRVSDKENYINNNIKYPTSLFDERLTYFAYVMVGRRKKGKNLMKKKQEIISKNMSLFDVCKKKYLDSCIRGVFDKSCLDEEGNLLSFNEQAAIITHFLQLQNRGGFSDTYRDKGCDLMKSWYSFINGQEQPVIYNDVVSEDQFYGNFFKDFTTAPFPAPENPTFSFIDLFAGIGGFRIAMQDCGGECVYSSEWDENAQKTYYYNFGDIPFGDITKEYSKSYIPDGFDVLCAGFPCQAFSIAGYRRGFDDTRGTLFFDVAEIIRRKRPKAVYLENVKNLYTHDEGRTFQVIKSTLEELGYVVYHKVMNAMEYANIPQNRERIFIVCFDPVQVPNHGDFYFPNKVELTNTIHNCIDDNEDSSSLFYGESMSHYEELVKGIKSRNTIYQWRRQYVRENKSNVCPTLTANMGTGGHNVPLILTKDNRIRKLSPKECLNFQGYPRDYAFPDSLANSARYKQAGNSVVVPLIRKVCQNIITTISKNM